MERAKQNRFKERWMPMMNKENEEEIQKEGKQLTSPWKHTQSLMNEPESQNQNSAEPNQKNPDEENQHRLDNLNPIGAEHLMKDGETLKTGKSSSQIPESTAGKEKGFGDWKTKAGKIGEKQKEGKKENVGNLQERKENAGNVTKKEAVATSKQLGQTLAQNEIEVEEIDDGPGKQMKQLKKRKWKHQAIKCDGKSSQNSGTLLKKRQNWEMGGTSPEHKRSKVVSSTTMTVAEYNFDSPQAKIKLNWEALSGEEMDFATTITEELTAKAGCQPRRQP